MRVGDLVTYYFQLPRWRKGESALCDVGIVVETGKYTANCDVKVLWKGEPWPQTEGSQHLALVDNICLTFS
jgi:hypothetical protein